MKKFKFIIDGHKYEVSVNEKENNLAEVEVNGTPFTVEIEKEVKITHPATTVVRPATAPAASTKTTGASEFVKSPLPGSIVKVLVTNGQAVKRGDVLLTMESMKMENNIVAEKDGIVKNVLVAPDQNVMQDDKLVEMTISATTTATVETPKVEAPKPAAKEEAPKAAAPTGGYKQVSPLPGSVVKVAVEVGQEVKKGDLLLTLESMKMENNIVAEKDGKVISVPVSAGQSVMQDDVLVILG